MSPHCRLFTNLKPVICNKLYNIVFHVTQATRGQTSTVCNIRRFLSDPAQNSLLSDNVGYMDDLSQKNTNVFGLFFSSTTFIPRSLACIKSLVEI